MRWEDEISHSVRVRASLDVNVTCTETEPSLLAQNVTVENHLLTFYDTADGNT